MVRSDVEFVEILGFKRIESMSFRLGGSEIVLLSVEVASLQRLKMLFCWMIPA